MNDMIVRTHVTADLPTCTHHEWAIVDSAKLAQTVTKLALGQYRHALSVLRTLKPNAAPPVSDEVKRHLEQLLSNDSDIDNRDGWLFQLISWTVAALADSELLLDPPHSQPSQKGFDGFFVLLSEDRSSVRAVVFNEDKATDYPRDTITQKVFPEIKAIESGRHDAQSLCRITTLLERSGVPDANLQAVLESAHWMQRRVYRIAVATSTSSLPTKVDLYCDFDQVVSGDPNRRLGESFHCDDLRAWFREFVELMLAELSDLNGAT